MRFIVKRAGSLNLEEVEMNVEEIGRITSSYYLPLAGEENIRMIVKPNGKKPNFVMHNNDNIVGYIDGDAIFVGNNNACEVISLTDEQVNIIKKSFEYNILWLN